MSFLHPVSAPDLSDANQLFAREFVVPTHHADDACAAISVFKFERT